MRRYPMPLWMIVLLTVVLTVLVMVVAGHGHL